MSDSVRYDWSGLSPAHEMVVSRVPPGTRVLEAGCNTGYMTAALVERGCRVTGVDNDQAALERATGIASEVQLVDLDAVGLDAVGSDYDVVIFADVLEHLKNPEAALMSARSVLAPGGRVIISIPNVAFWRVRWDLLRGRFDYTEYGILDRTHLHFYTEASLRRLIDSCGYELRTLDRFHEALPTRGSRFSCVRRTREWAESRLELRASNLTAFQFVVVLAPASGNSVSPVS